MMSKVLYATSRERHVVMTNGVALFEFESADSRLWKPYEITKKNAVFNVYKLLTESWQEVIGVNARAAIPVIEAGTDDDDKNLMTYETEKGNHIYMGMDYRELALTIIDQRPTIKVQMPKDEKGRIRGDLRLFLVFEGEILRGVISNRRK